MLFFGLFKRENLFDVQCVTVFSLGPINCIRVNSSLSSTHRNKFHSISSFFFLANIGLLLLPVKYLHNLQNYVGYPEPERLLTQFIREAMFYPESGNQRPYSPKKNQIVQTGLSHAYISIIAKHNQRHKNKLKMKAHTKINPNPNWLHPDWPVAPLRPHPDSPCLCPNP